MAGPAPKPSWPLARLAGALLAALLLAAAALLWWVGQTASFVDWALARAVAASNGALQAGPARGTLLDGVRVERLAWLDGEHAIELRGVSLGWRPAALLRSSLHFTRIEVASASVRLLGEAAAPALPQSLALPLRVRVDALGVGELRVALPAQAPVELLRLAFSGRYTAGAWRVDHLSAESPQWGEARFDGRIGDSAPFALELAGRLAPRIEGWGPLPQVRVLADGTLDDFALAAQALPPAGASDAQAPAPVWIGLDTRVRAFAQRPAQRFAPIELTLDAVEPAQLGLAEAPIARISGSATIRVGDTQIEGRLALRNALPGPIDRHALPLATLDTGFSLSSTRISLTGLQAGPAGGGTLAGDASADLARPLTLFGHSLPQIRMQLALREIDLSQLASGLAKTRLAGTVKLDGATFDLDLADATRRGISASALARIDAMQLRVERARLETPAGSVSARGNAALAAPWKIDLEGDFSELDPAGAFALRTVFGASAARFGADLPEPWIARARGRLAGRWAAQGIAWPEPLLQTRLAVERGRLDGEPLQFDWRGEVSRERVARVALALAFGDLRADARGSLGAFGDRLRFSLRAGSLARLDARAAGSASVSGELSGGWSRGASLGVIADLEGRQLRWAGEALRAGSLSGRIELPDLRAGRVALRLDARTLAVAGRDFDRAGARIDGEVDAHTLRLELVGPQANAQASARGALLHEAVGGWRWSGSVDEFTAAAPVSIRLQAPAPLLIDARGAVLGEAALQVDGGSVDIAALAWRDGALQTRGQASGLPLTRWAERFAGPQALPGVQLEDLRLRGSWDLSGDSLQAPSGRLSLRIDAGEADGSRAAGSRGEADLRLDQGRLEGTIDMRVPTLAFANRLIGPEWAAAGRLRFTGTVGGTVVQPGLRGALEGSELALVQRALGWRLSNGTLSARFDGDRLALDALRLESGAGSITMSGQLLLDGMHGGFTLRAERLPVPIGPGQRVVLSGNTGIASSGSRFDWKGDIRADEGLIELRGGEAPTLPDDVVIVDRDATSATTPNGGDAASRGFAIGADLNLDLGERLRVRGSGVDVLLAGSVNLRGTLPDAPRAFGTVRVKRGTYSAYGQQLEIERGQVVFNGPLDNPVLDIVAMRRNQPVEAGVALTGTVLSPRLRLVSTPEVPDSQKLSWLVLGIGLDDVDTAGQGAALQAAAATLFASNDGGLSAGLAGALGLDILTVRSAGAASAFDPNFGAAFPGQATTGGVPVGTAAQNVVAIGKRLGSRVFVTYEQGLHGVWNLLRIQYDITNRLSIRGQAGTDSALDVLYFFSFD